VKLGYLRQWAIYGLYMAQACAHLCHQCRHLLMLVAMVNLGPNLQNFVKCTDKKVYERVTNSFVNYS